MSIFAHRPNGVYAERRRFSLGCACAKKQLEIFLLEGFTSVCMQCGSEWGNLTTKGLINDGI
jgi:hypothetical protein